MNKLITILSVLLCLSTAGAAVTMSPTSTADQAIGLLNFEVSGTGRANIKIHSGNIARIVFAEGTKITFVTCDDLTSESWTYLKGESYLSLSSHPFQKGSYTVFFSLRGDSFAQRCEDPMGCLADRVWPTIKRLTKLQAMVSVTCSANQEVKADQDAYIAQLEKEHHEKIASEKSPQSDQKSGECKVVKYPVRVLGVTGEYLVDKYGVYSSADGNPNSELRTSGGMNRAVGYATYNEALQICRNAEKDNRCSCVQ